MPIVITLCGAALTVFITMHGQRGREAAARPVVRSDGAGVGVYVGLILFVIPALEQRKVVPDMARFVARTGQNRRPHRCYPVEPVEPVFRFTWIATSYCSRIPADAAVLRPDATFHAVMSRRAFDEFVAQGKPLEVVYERDGISQQAAGPVAAARRPRTIRRRPAGAIESTLMMHFLRPYLIVLVCAGAGTPVFVPTVLHAQGPRATPTAPAGPFGALRWRSLGPPRGGRSIAAEGSVARPNEDYMGATGGGLWKTTDGGDTWKPVTDGQINSSSVGAVAIAPSNPDVVYIGTGESEIRGNIIQGDGAYKSTDGGKTWTHIGLTETQVISKIRVHPTNPDLVYVAAFGHHAAPNPERGVFRSKDGGKTWDKILFRDNKTGAIELILDPEESAGDLRRACGRRIGTPGRCRAAGPAAESSSRRTAAIAGPRSREIPACRKAMLGKIGLSVSGADSNRVYAQIEAEDGGFFLSDDAGAHVDEGDRPARPAAARVLLHARVRGPEGEGHGLRAERRVPQVDGHRQDLDARSRPPHGDNHDMWIAPNDSDADDRSKRRRRERVGQRRRDVDGADDADLAVLSRDHDGARAVSRLRRATGQQHGVRVEPAADRVAPAARAAESIRCSIRPAAGKAGTSPAIRATRTSTMRAATAG